MKRFRITVLVLLLVVPVIVSAIDIAVSDSARLDITSRTSFGIYLDDPRIYGLSNELTQLDLVFGLAPYQRLSNRLNSPEWVGFIELTFFNLDLIKSEQAIGGQGPGGISTNRYQTGEFITGLVKDPWLIQLNAGGNEPFVSPWNKGMQFINDGFKFSWAYLDSMVDIVRRTPINRAAVLTGRGEENMGVDGHVPGHATMTQFSYDSFNVMIDRFGGNINGGEMVAVMYNTDDFGVNVKFGTQFAVDSGAIGYGGMGYNGLAMGVDMVFTPTTLDGLKVFFSTLGSYNWGEDANPDPFMAGTRVGYTINLNDDISIEPWVGFDMGVFIAPDVSTRLGHEASFGFTMRWPGQGGWLKDYIINSDGRVFPGMSLGYKIYTEQDVSDAVEHSIKFTLFEPKGDDGLFYKIGSEIVIDFKDISGSTLKLKDEEGEYIPDNISYPSGFVVFVTAYFDYEINNLIPGTLRPWTVLFFDNYRKEPGSDERISDLKIDLGVNLENAIQNTTFGIVWNSGSLIQKEFINNRGKVTKSVAGYMRAFVEIKL